MRETKMPKAQVLSETVKLMPSGKLAAGVINAKGKLAERLNYDYTGEGDTREVRVFARFASEDKPREVSVKFKDAKTANEQWKKQPDQQLAYAGARTWGRRHTPELLLGITFAEEAEAMTYAPPVTRDLPKIQSAALAPDASVIKPRAMDEVIDPETGEVTEVPTEREKPHPFEAKTWGDFVAPLTKAIQGATTIEEIDEWIKVNQETLLKMKESKPDLYRSFEKNIEPRKMELILLHFMNVL